MNPNSLKSQLSHFTICATNSSLNIKIKGIGMESVSQMHELNLVHISV